MPWGLCHHFLYLQGPKHRAQEGRTGLPDQPNATIPSICSRLLTIHCLAAHHTGGPCHLHAQQLDGEGDSQPHSVMGVSASRKQASVPLEEWFGDPQLPTAAPASYLEPYGPATAVTQGAHARHQVTLQPVLEGSIVIRVLRVKELLLWEGRQGKDRIRAEAVITMSGFPPKPSDAEKAKPRPPCQPHPPAACPVPSPAMMTSMGTVWHSSRRSGFSCLSFTFLLSVREGSCRDGEGQRSHLPATSASSGSLIFFPISCPPEDELPHSTHDSPEFTTQ